MSERDEFEACAKGRFYLDHIGGESEQADEYAFDTTDAAWQAWQAARATPKQAVPALTESHPIMGVLKKAMGLLALSGEMTNAEALGKEARAILAAPQPSPEPRRYQD